MTYRNAGRKLKAAIDHLNPIGKHRKNKRLPYEPWELPLFIQNPKDIVGFMIENVLQFSKVVANESDRDDKEQFNARLQQIAENLNVARRIVSKPSREFPSYKHRQPVKEARKILNDHNHCPCPQPNETQTKYLTDPVVIPLLYQSKIMNFVELTATGSSNCKGELLYDVRFFYLRPHQLRNKKLHMDSYSLPEAGKFEYDVLTLTNIPRQTGFKTKQAINRHKIDQMFLIADTAYRYSEFLDGMFKLLTGKPYSCFAHLKNEDKLDFLPVHTRHQSEATSEAFSLSKELSVISFYQFPNAYDSFLFYVCYHLQENPEWAQEFQDFFNSKHRHQLMPRFGLCSILPEEFSPEESSENSVLTEVIASTPMFEKSKSSSESVFNSSSSEQSEAESDMTQAEKDVKSTIALLKAVSPPNSETDAETEEQRESESSYSQSSEDVPSEDNLTSQRGLSA